MAVSSFLQFPESGKNLGLEPEDFSDPTFVEVVKHGMAIEYRGEKGEVPLADIEVIMKRDGLVDSLGLVPIASYDQAASWIKALKEFSVAATLDFQIHHLWSSEYGDAPGSSRVEALRDILSGAQMEVSTTEALDMASITSGFLSSAKEALERGEEQYISTGLTLTDRYLRGLRPGDLTYVASDAGSGKSTLLQYLARCVARQGKKVLLYSGEMSEAQLGEREAAAIIGKELTADWNHGAEVSAAMRLVPELDYLRNIKVDTAPTISLAALEGKIRRLISTTGLDLFAVDHIEHISFAQDLSDNDRQRRAIMGLKALCKIYQVPGIVLGHINRDGEKSLYEKDIKPNKSWLRGSTHLSGTPDNVIIPIRLGTTCDVDCYVIKSRMGLTGGVRLVYNPYYGSYSEGNSW